MSGLMRRLLVAVLAVAMLGGCAGWKGLRGIEPGLETRASIEARFGKPVAIWEDAEGGQSLEYSSQPYGDTCFMVRVDPAGTVRAVDQVLERSWRGKVERGMTREQVSRLLGRHRSVEFFPRVGEEVWDWTVNRDPSSTVRFNVHFKEGVVAYTSESHVSARDRCWFMMGACPLGW